jgi:hypothetical protein
MEFFEKECGVQFIDASTGKKALDIIAENEQRKSNLYNNPAYKSDYDIYLESGGEENE